MVSKISAGKSLLSIKLANRRARKIYKKSIKDPSRYESQWKFDWVIKKIKKAMKAWKITINVKGYEHIPKTNFVVCSNHLSATDPAIVIWAMAKKTEDRDVQNRRVVFIAKKEIKDGKEGKSFSGFTNMIETIYVDRDNPKSALEAMNELCKYLKDHPGVGVSIFPEGTRTKDGKIAEFKGGAFYVAKKNFIPIIPATINYSNQIKNTKRGRLEVEIIFHKPLKPIDFIGMDNKALAEKVRKIVASKYVEPTNYSKENI